MVRGMTGYEQGAADMTGNALKEFSRIADYDKDLAPLQEALVESIHFSVTSAVICPLIWIV